LDKEHFNVVFIYLSSYGVDRNLLEEAGYDVFYLSDTERNRGFRFSILHRLVGILKEHNVDILHCHHHKPSVYGALAGMFAKTPVVLSHVHGLNRTRNIRRKLLNFFILKKISKVIGCAQSVRQDVLKNNPTIEPEKVIVLENSVDFKRFTDISTVREDARRMLGLSRDAFVFGTIGRLAPTKGLPYLIEAFVRVKEQKPSANLVLVGDGRCRAELEQQAANTVCHNSIHFLGRKDNVERLIKGIDVFVLASVAEGMPLVILEAMAAGVACVATKVGGIPEVVNSEDMALLVPPRDSEALACAMIRAANMPKDKLERFTKKAQDRVRQFYSHHVVREKLRKLYEEELNACIKNC